MRLINATLLMTVLAVPAVAAAQTEPGAPSLGPLTQERPREVPPLREVNPPPSRRTPPIRESTPSRQPAGRRSTQSEESDHEKVVGRVGFSWFGVSEIPIGPGSETVVAPAIGIRYWFSDLVGFDLGVGAAIDVSGRETDTTGASAQDEDNPSTYGFLVHLGAPVAVYYSSHFTFLIIPETNIGYAQRSDTDSEFVPVGFNEEEKFDLQDRLTGFRFDFGVRVGAEVHFGFMGLPNLSLEGSVGAYATHEIRSSSVERLDNQGFDIGVATDEVTETRTRFFTTVTNDPWDFFRASVAARYYF